VASADHLAQVPAGEPVNTHCGTVRIDTHSILAGVFRKEISTAGFASNSSNGKVLWQWVTCQKEGFGVSIDITWCGKYQSGQYYLYTNAGANFTVTVLFQGFPIYGSHGNRVGFNPFTSSSRLRATATSKCSWPRRSGCAARSANISPESGVTARDTERPRENEGAGDPDGGPRRGTGGGDLDGPMRIPDEWLDSVFFLGIERPGEDGTQRVVYGGTGFYVRVVNELDPDLHRLYLVTARHNIEDSRKEAGRLILRVNTDDGGSVSQEISKFGWTFHDDPTVDVAVVGPGFRRGGRPGLQHTYVEADQFVTPENIRDNVIGLGTEIAIIGLFNQREGSGRNIPIVRSGVIAATAEELVDDGTGHGPYRAYLAETMSIGGLSGSPVYVLPEPSHRHQMTTPRPGVLRVGPMTVTYPVYVLGMVRSHWDERPASAGPQDIPRREWMNRGIAAVTPIGGVLDVLNSKAFREQRRRQARRSSPRPSRR
jgi:hypothetical protein